MNLIFLGLTTLLILLNIAGLGLLLQRYTPHYALAKPVAVIGLCLLLFFLEHFVGLGRLAWVWPITTAVAAYLCWRERTVLQQNWPAELAFVLAFGYGLAWRFIYPNIDPSSEHVTDLYFITNYLPGSRLPSLDYWLPPYRFNFYYAFQHYGAALLGRIFGLDSGTTYNFSFCVMIGMIISTAWFTIGQFCKQRAARLLVLFAFVLGGTGVSPMLHFLIDPHPAPQAQVNIQPIGTEQAGNALTTPPGPMLTPWSSIRFIGSSDVDINTKLGHELFPPFDPATKPLGFVPLDLPLETFSYLVFLGDFHPPLASFLLLIIALACIGVLEHHPQNRFAQAVLAGTVPLTLISNTWIFPLHALLVVSWLAYRYWRRTPPDWKTLIIAGMAGFALIYPALTEFAAQSLSPSMHWVVPHDHTPWREFLALHWPLLALLLLSLFQRSTRKLALFMFLLWGGLFLLSEMIFVDDIYGGQFNRFNTALKWWGWIYAGALITLGALNLGGDSRVARYGTVLVMLLVSTYSYELANTWLSSSKTDIGHFNGHNWFTYDPTNKAMLNYLSSAEPGIVLDRNEKGSYTRSSTFALFSGKPALLGWADHEWMWRGSPTHVRMLGDQISAFYLGNKGDCLEWLLYNDVRYILWGADENGRSANGFNIIQQLIGTRYYWKEFYNAGDYRVGIWVRKPPN